MKHKPVRLTYEDALVQGETMQLPQALTAQIGPGRWRLSVQPVRRSRTRSHSAFLNSYSAEDEGLYDDCTAP